MACCTAGEKPREKPQPAGNYHFQSENKDILLIGSSWSKYLTTSSPPQKNPQFSMWHKHENFSGQEFQEVRCDVHSEQGILSSYRSIDSFQCILRESLYHIWMGVIALQQGKAMGPQRGEDVDSASVDGTAFGRTPLLYQTRCSLLWM